MTAPVPITPSNAKAWVALIGSLLGALVPIAGQVAGVLPPPWGAILSGIIAVIGLVTGKAVHQTSNLPPNVVITAPTDPAAPPAGGWQNPWRN